MRGRGAAGALFLSAMLALAAGPAAADIVLEYTEAAPRDRLVVRNAGGCDPGPLEVTLDLSGAPGGLFFDTSASGAGVSVFQPFEWVAGAEILSGTSRVADGDQVLVLRFRHFPAGAEAEFSFDLDDSDPAGPLGPSMLSPAEMAGAAAHLVLEPGTAVERRLTAPFDATATARIPLTLCVS
jgi:hypothetical protein